MIGPCLAEGFPYYFRNYQVSNGLSGNTITDIVQDKKGFIWFGTRNGLNRFDGNAFKIFRSEPGDAYSIGTNTIFSLHEDITEKLWVGTNKGIYIYNPVDDRFTSFKAISCGEVRFLKGDKDGNVWIIADFLLYKHNLKTGSLKSFPLKNDETISVHISDKGEVWTATKNGLIRLYNAKTGRFRIYDMPGLDKNRDIYTKMTLQTFGDSTLIIGTMKRVLMFNYHTRKISDLLNESNQSKDTHIHTIFRNSNNQIWMGSESGLYILDMKSGKKNHVFRQNYNAYSISDNIVNTIFQDKEGGVWIGTQFGGVNYYSPQFDNFQKYFPQPDKNSISGNVIHEICKDQYNKIWIGTEDAGLNQLDVATGTIRSFMADGKKGSIYYKNIHGMVADGDKLWIGTYEHGLDVMDLKTNKVIRHYGAANNSKSFKSNFIVTIYRTKAGDILVGTWEGLYKYNRKTDDFSHLSFFDSQIQGMHEDDEGTLWVASYGGGVYYYNEKTNKKGRILYAAGKPDGLLENYINSLYQSKNKDIWLSTEHGLSRYTPSTGKFTNYRMENGLPDNQVFRVLEDNGGNLWVSTSRGLARLDPKTGKFTNYHKENGLPTEQFNYNSSFKNDDGTLFFGTVSGMISFRPSGFAQNKFIPPVYITGLQVNNKEVDIRAEESPLKEHIIYADRITLPYYNSNVSFDVAALSYIMPEMNNYRYQMEGLDKEWTYLNNNRKIYFSKLPPGSYTFKIKGSNNDQIWNETETRLRIKILPSIWETTWAYVTYILLIAGIIVVIFRYYYLALNEKNKRQIETIEIGKEREIYNAKIDFFTNVAHEIRTPLTLIKMPLDKLLTRIKSDPESIESLNMINKNTNRLIDLTNQLLDFRKAEANNFSLNFTKTDINEMLNDVFSTFKPAAEQKQLSYKLEQPRITLHAYVDNEALKKIISNLISNAIKYADQSVKVKLLPFNSDDFLFYIEFSNDGALVQGEHKEKIFEPFFRINVDSRETGTGIGLPLARSLAELHKGKLELKPAVANMNTFLLSLPIHQDYEMDLDSEEKYDTDSNLFGAAEEKVEFDPAKPLIMIVEDNSDILGYLYRELSTAYNVIKAGDGQQAVGILQEENVQLVISDIMMPIMDGITLCRTMKNDVRFSHVPIILLTAKNSVSSEIEGLEVGADAYIKKPFSLDHLSAQINNLLHNRNIIKEYFARTPLTHIKGIAFSKADKDFLEQLNEIINEHISESNLDVDMLSAMMHMSRPTLYRKIKGISDMTPNELINLSRLKKAAELLAEKNYRINEIADMVGYSMSSNFSRDFQKQFGVSPSHYVNNL